MLDNKKIYAQISSCQDQTPDSLSPLVLTFNQNNKIYGIEHSEDKPSDIIIKESGVYLIISAGQIGRKSGSLLRFCDMWLRVNGKDIPNTGVRCSAPASLFVGDTTVLVIQLAMPFEKGDVLNVVLSVSEKDEGLGIIAIKPDNGPLIPSIINTIVKL